MIAMAPVPMTTRRAVAARLPLLLGSLLLPLAACAPSRGDSPGGSPRESPGENDPRPEFPNEAALWRLERYRDETGTIPARAWQLALEQRAVTVAATAAVDKGGVSPLAWTSRGPGNVAGRTRSIAIDPRNPQRIWVGAVSGGLWRSDDGGAHWTVIDDWWSNLSVGCVALDPQDPDVMYAGTGEGFWSLAHLLRNVSHFVRGAGVLESTDGGATWTQLASTAGWQHTTRIAISPTDSNLLLASRRPGGLSRSTDRGRTWTDVATGIVSDPFSYQVLFDPNDSSNAIAHLAPGSAASHGVITSTDAGLTWQPAATGLTGVAGEDSRIELAYARSSPGTVYASVGAGGAGGGQVWRSTDGGRNWTLRTQAGHSTGAIYYYNGLWVDPTDADNLLVTALVVWRSTDGGQTFQQISSFTLMTPDPHPDVHTAVEDPGYDGTTNRRVYVATDGGVHVTDDILTALPGRWRDLDATMRSTQFYAAAGHSGTDVVIGGTQDNGTLRVVGSSSTANLVFGGDGGQVQIDPTDPRFVYGETQFLFVHRSTDGGASASLITSGLGDTGPGGSSNFISPLRLDPNAPQRLYAGGRSLWRTDDARGAATWSGVKPDVGSLISAIAIAPGMSDRIFVGHNDGRLYRTSNGTAATPVWTALDDNAGRDPLPDRVLTRLCVDPTDSTVVYATFGGFSADNVWRSADAGLTWQPIPGAAPFALPPAPVYGLCVHPDAGNVLYAATEVGLFASDDAGAHWSASNDGPANVVCEEVTFAHGPGPRRLVLATLGRGLWTAEVRLPSAIPFGGPCAGLAAPPRLGVDPRAPARLGRTMTFTGASLRAGQPFALLAVGLSDTVWGGMSLPAPLDAFGLVGCTLYTSVDVALVSGISGSGEATWDLALPAAARFLGVSMHAQILAPDPGANPAGLVVSGALTVTSGW